MGLSVVFNVLLSLPCPPPSLGHLLWLDKTRPPPHSPCLGSALQPHLILGLTWPLGLPFLIFLTCFDLGFVSILFRFWIFDVLGVV